MVSRFADLCMAPHDIRAELKVELPPPEPTDEDTPTSSFEDFAAFEK
jgi:hypothetical protein